MFNFGFFKKETGVFGFVSLFIGYFWFLSTEVAIHSKKNKQSLACLFKIILP